jgi:hypothetical protein
VFVKLELSFWIAFYKLSFLWLSLNLVLWSLSFSVSFCISSLFIYTCDWYAPRGGRALCVWILIWKGKQTSPIRLHSGHPGAGTPATSSIPAQTKYRYIYSYRQPLDGMGRIHVSTYLRTLLHSVPLFCSSFSFLNLPYSALQ